MFYDAVIDAMSLLQWLARILPGAKVFVRGDGYDPISDMDCSTDLFQNLNQKTMIAET